MVRTRRLLGLLPLTPSQGWGAEPVGAWTPTTPTSPLWLGNEEKPSTRDGAL